MDRTTTTSFTPPVATTGQDYDALKLTNEEYFKLLSTGHPGGFTSIAQDNAWEAFQRLERLGNPEQS